MVCNRICCFKLFQLCLNCFLVWSWIIRTHAPEFRTPVVAIAFTACHTQISVTRGSVRITRSLGPTMTARGQSIGISIGMLPQTLIMSRLDQLFATWRTNLVFSLFIKFLPCLWTTGINYSLPKYFQNSRFHCL
jgi:hypothetical protein